MRIALVVHAFPPRSTAGVEVCALRQARALRSLGHEVLVVAAAYDLGRRQGESWRREQDGVPVCEIASLHPEGSLRATWACRELELPALAALREFGPDVVHFHHLLNLSAGLVAAAGAAGFTTALTLHDYWLSCARDGLRQRADRVLCERVDHETCARCLVDSPYLAPAPQRRLLAAAGRLGLGPLLQGAYRRLPRLGAAGLRALRGRGPGSGADLVDELGQRDAALLSAFAAADVRLAPTRFAARVAREAGLAGEIRIVPNGASWDPPRPFVPRPRRQIGFVGTLAPHKGALELVEAFRAVPAADARLTLWGSGRSAPDYLAQVTRAARADPRVRLAGPFAEGEQAAAYGALDLLVLPSLWWENAPLVVLEALAHGLPVIATRVGGVPELVAPPWGELVPPGDVPALGAALSAAVEGRLFADPLPPAPVATVEQSTRALLAILEETHEGRAAGRPRP